MKRTACVALCVFVAALFAVNSCSEKEKTGVAAPTVSDDAPRVRLCISGTMQGRLEPCGCASGQWGGLARRSFWLQSTADHDILIEGGDVVTGGTELDYLKFFTALSVLDMSAYHVLGIGPKDLQLSPEDFAATAGGFGFSAVSSDIVAGEDSGWPGKPYAEVDVRGTSVRIASLTKRLGDQSRGLRLLSPQEAWRRALDGAPDRTLRVLMVHDGPEQVRAAAALRPAPDLVIGFTQVFSEPPSEPDDEGGVPVVFAGIRGRVMLDLTLARLESGPRIVRYRPVPLAGSQTLKGAMEDKTVKEIILAHRHEVAQSGVLEQLAERRPPNNGSRYVGSRKCEECHLEDYETWQGTAHSRAWGTLVEAERDPTRYGWPVTKYPDCVGCHVVGYGEVSGFVNMARTPLLGSVGCEACHGAGSAHVESGGNTSMGRVGPEGCMGCHDFEQTPAFDFTGRHWPAIEHGR